MKHLLGCVVLVSGELELLLNLNKYEISIMIVTSA